MTRYYPPYPSPLPVVFYLPYPVQWPSPPSWALPSPALAPQPELPPAPIPRTIPLGGAPEDRSHSEPTPAPRPNAPPPTPRYRPHVDPVIAYTRNTTQCTDLGWDLMQNPRTLLTTRGTLSCSALSWGDLTRRWAAQAGGKPLRSLVLVFRYLPLQIEIKPWRPSSARHTPPGDAAAYVSVWDVLDGLYDGLRGSADPEMVSNMPHYGPEPPEDILYRAASRRLKLLPDDRRPGEPLIRKVDFLRGRRRFLGIRVAERDEVPKGRRLGEVFVVEVGNSQS